MNDPDDHPWRNRPLGIKDDGVWVDYVTIMQRKPLWMPLDHTIDGASAPVDLLKQWRSGTVYASRCDRSPNSYVPPEWTLLLATHGVETTCTKCGGSFQSPVHQHNLRLREICPECNRKQRNEYQRRRHERAKKALE